MSERGYVTEAALSREPAEMLFLGAKSIFPLGRFPVERQWRSKERQSDNWAFRGTQ
jgi:hypothetical protein